MMHRILILIILSVSLMGQSAYYRLGYGNLFPTTDPVVSSLGYGMVANKDTVHVNMQNPAALSGMKRVFFGASLGSEFTSINNVVSNNTRLEQIYLASPIGRNLGFSFGINAISDFASNYQLELESGSLKENSQGGIWDYSVGLGYTFSDNYSFGVKYHLLHGMLRRATSHVSGSTTEEFVVKGDISGRSLEIGALTMIADKVSLGLTIDLPYSTPTFQGVDSLSGTSASNDFSESLAAWPTTVKFGLVYHHSKYNKVLAGVSQQMFSEDGFKDSKIFALPEGWKTVPVASFQLAMMHVATDRSSRNWVRRTGWQAGVSIKNYYLAPSADTYIYEYALITGLNLGLRNTRGLFDISGEFGSRGGADSLPDELFARVKFAVQVSDYWYRKVKRR